MSHRTDDLSMEKNEDGHPDMSDHMSDGSDMKNHRQESSELAPATVILTHQLQSQDQEQMQGEGLMPSAQKTGRGEIVKFL